MYFILSNEKNPFNFFIGLVGAVVCLLEQKNLRTEKGLRGKKEVRNVHVKVGQTFLKGNYKLSHIFLDSRKYCLG